MFLSMSIKLRDYVLDRYTNMQGTYFAKHIKGTGSGSIAKEIESQSIKARVFNSVACSVTLSKVKVEVKDENDDDENEKSCGE